MVHVVNLFFLFLCMQLVLLSHALAVNSPPIINTICIGDLPLTTATKDYESNARKLALKHQLTDVDVLTRLIFSEGLSTGCLNHPDCSSASLFKSHIFDKIGWGMALRIKKNVYDMVFKKFQFRTSFSPKMNGQKKNIYAQFFLCPEKSEAYLKEGKIKFEELFQSAFQTAQEIKNKKSIPVEYQKVTNFFYPQSPVFGHLTPRWATDSHLLKEISNEWVRFYQVK